MRIKASSSHGNDVEFDIGDTTLIVADNQNAEQENLTTIHNGATPLDSWSRWIFPTCHLIYTKTYINPNYVN